jgi:hypothetical protein
MADTDNNQRKGNTCAPIVFVDTLGSMPAAALKWQEDVKAGRTVHYCTSSGRYLGNTGDTPTELAGWLSKPSST